MRCKMQLYQLLQKRAADRPMHKTAGQWLDEHSFTKLCKQVRKRKGQQSKGC